MKVQVLLFVALPVLLYVTLPVLLPLCMTLVSNNHQKNLKLSMFIMGKISDAAKKVMVWFAGGVVIIRILRREFLKMRYSILLKKRDYSKILVAILPLVILQLSS